MVAGHYGIARDADDHELLDEHRGHPIPTVSSIDQDLRLE
jgi:hypothetical protein